MIRENVMKSLVKVFVSLICGVNEKSEVCYVTSMRETIN
jgi:hypothetical protein